MRKVQFCKMHGLGNNYIYIYDKDSALNDLPELAKYAADQNFGIGSDGLIVISGQQQVLNETLAGGFMMRIFNADGSEGKMCGNGIRCVGKFIFEKGLSDKQQLNIETLAGPRTLRLEVESAVVKNVTVNMGEPMFAPEDVPVSLAANDSFGYVYEVGGKQYQLYSLSMGNPHCVIFVPKITDLLLRDVGQKLSSDSLFPEGVNVEFAKIIDRHTIEMRVWERGSGETMACGTGACAVLAAAVRLGHVDDSATVKLLGGDLSISWNQNDNCIYKSGPAEFICCGELYRPDLVASDISANSQS